MYQHSTLRGYRQPAAASDKKAAIHADTFNAFLFDKKIRTKLNKPDLTLIIVSGCSLVRHLIVKNDSPATAGSSIFAPFNFVAHTKPSGGTGSLRLPPTKARQQFAFLQRTTDVRDSSISDDS